LILHHPACADHPFALITNHALAYTQHRQQQQQQQQQQDGDNNSIILMPAPVAVVVSSNTTVASGTGDEVNALLLCSIMLYQLAV